MANELDIDGNDFHYIEAAVELARDQDKITWLTASGKRIAAIVPVELAELYEQNLADVLATPVMRIPGAQDAGWRDYWQGKPGFREGE